MARMDSDNGLTGVRIVVTGWLETTLEERGHIILAIVLDIIGKLTQGTWQLPSRTWSLGNAAGSLPSPIPIRKMWRKSTMKLWWISLSAHSYRPNALDFLTNFSNTDITFAAHQQLKSLPLPFWERAAKGVMCKGTNLCLLLNWTGLIVLGSCLAFGQGATAAISGIVRASTRRSRAWSHYNSSLDARNFFEDAKGPFQRNQFRRIPGRLVRVEIAVLILAGRRNKMATKRHKSIAMPLANFVLFCGSSPF